jgi:hypothetical protein
VANGGQNIHRDISKHRTECQKLDSPEQHLCYQDAIYSPAQKQYRGPQLHGEAISGKDNEHRHGTAARVLQDSTKKYCIKKLRLL